MVGSGTGWLSLLLDGTAILLSAILLSVIVESSSQKKSAVGEVGELEPHSSHQLVQCISEVRWGSWESLPLPHSEDFLVSD